MSDTSVVFNLLAKDKASGVIASFGKNVASIAAGFGLGQLAVGGLSKAFSFAKGAAIDFNSQLQNSSIAFTTMLGSGKKAQVFLDQLQAFARSTPFEFGDLVQNAQNMMGMGIAAKDVIPDLRALGDSVASVGGSAEQVNQVTLAFDQMAAKGTLDMGNMNQLMQGGVPTALKVMAAGFHVTTGQMIKMISSGKVASSQALPMLVAGIEKGTKSTAALGGMMDKQSNTFSGAMSNISDSLTQALAGAFKPFFNVASTGAQKLATWLGSPTFAKFGARVSAGISTAIAWVGKLIAKINFKAVGAAIGALVGWFTGKLVPAVRGAAATFMPVVRIIAGAAVGAFHLLLAALRPLGSVITGVFGFVAAHKTTFQTLAVAILAIVAAVKTWTLVTTIWTTVTKIAAAAQVLFNTIMAMNPIGLIILAVVGLVAAFIYLWTHVAGFRKFWIAVWDGIKVAALAVAHWFAGPFVHALAAPFVLIKNIALAIGHWFAGPFVGFFVGMWHAVERQAVNLWNWFKSLPGKLKNALVNIGLIVTTPFRWAFDKIADLWNGTVGKLSFTVPSWVPGIGGNGFSMPKLPHLATGGDITRSGLARVGENGPETVLLPAGARVLPHGESGGAGVCIHLHGSARALMTDIAAEVRGRYGGNVQVALGGGH